MCDFCTHCVLLPLTHLLQLTHSLLSCASTHTHIRTTHVRIQDEVWHAHTSLASRLNFPSAQSFFLFLFLHLSLSLSLINLPSLIPLSLNVFQDYFFFIKMLYYHVWHSLQCTPSQGSKGIRQWLINWCTMYIPNEDTWN